MKWKQKYKRKEQKGARVFEYPPFISYNYYISYMLFVSLPNHDFRIWWELMFPLFALIHLCPYYFPNAQSVWSWRMLYLFAFCIYERCLPSLPYFVSKTHICMCISDHAHLTVLHHSRPHIHTYEWIDLLSCIVPVPMCLYGLLSSLAYIFPIPMCLYELISSLFLHVANSHVPLCID